ncbi:diaminobutyrate acetyltransferase [Oceanobacillus alkalisoli]|uniref:diaminobutyrate acetyltransferase n=1 Tax=Oceanobacillus alkalisoli TaxID=2925113 RepID=UPI0028732113|nr:diaminobutyrate acetyltransferase [Oceanobacillus alkalisoli]
MVKKELHFRKPNKEDGAAVWELIKQTGNLDLNSSYSYIMWCEIFSETSIVAIEEKGYVRKPVAFVSGFIHPDNPDTLFIWQVAVHGSQRGQGLATRMLNQLLERKSCEKIRYIETTVTTSNTASNNLFIGLARKHQANYKISKYFNSEIFPEAEDETHEEEWLYRIGPVNK